jgi:hypothetical protein
VRPDAEELMKRLVFVVLIACLSLALLTGVAAAAGKAPPTTAKFPAGAKLTVASVPPFFWIFSWTAATGTFDTYCLDLVKTSKPAGAYSFATGLATRFVVETIAGDPYPYCKPGAYSVAVSVLSKGVVCDSLSVKGTVTLK